MYKQGQKVLIEAEIVSNANGYIVARIPESVDCYNMRIRPSAVRPMPEPFDPMMVKAGDEVLIRATVLNPNYTPYHFDVGVVGTGSFSVRKEFVAGFALPPLPIPDPKTKAEYDALTVSERERFWAAKAKGGA